MHSKLWLLTVLLLSCHHFAYGRLPVPRQFQRFFRMKSSDVNANEKTDPERIEIPLFGFEWLRGSKFIGRLRSQDNVLSRIGRSPQAQEFVLQLSNKIVNYAFAYLALKLISNSVYSAMKDAKSYFDSMKESPFQGSFNATKFLKPNTTLNSHEEEIFSTIVVPSSIESGMQDIGGLSVVKEVLVDMFQPQLAQQQNVTGPLQQLLSPVKSLLLYGPPGCGKSMLARALCKHLNVPMLNIVPSLLLRMYVGETSRLTKALFTLASKMQPCLVFIDEADALFAVRRSSESNGVDRKLLTEFMQLWDDLVRDKVDVYIIGATNRPQDVDPAFLRRFERSFLIGPPDLPARKEVLQSLLGGVALDPAFDFDMCAWRMEGYTPSDMIAVCRAAMLMPAQEARKAQQATSISDENGDDAGSSPAPLRPLRTQDIELALQSVLPTSWASHAYGQQEQQQQQPYGAAGVSPVWGAPSPPAAGVGYRENGAYYEYGADGLQGQGEQRQGQEGEPVSPDDNEEDEEFDDEEDHDE